MTKKHVDFFNAEAAQSYDERNKNLSAIADNLHFLMRLILKDLPAQAKILSVGAGTGAEILALAKTFPEWEFVALEPSQSMLDVCRSRMEKAGIANRCKFVCGYIDDFSEAAEFDAVLTILVAHFIDRNQRAEFFQNVVKRLRKGGHLINAEISYDLDSKEFRPMLGYWKEVQTLMGATAESLEKLPTVLKEMLHILPPEETKDLIEHSGISHPVQFFQSFMIHAWHGLKTS